jgi:hypothetical protein
VSNNRCRSFGVSAWRKDGFCAVVPDDHNALGVFPNDRGDAVFSLTGVDHSLDNRLKGAESAIRS